MKLVSPGSLTGAERLVFDNLKGWLPAKGVCINVMLGQDPWDIRPLILTNNKVSLYRFSRPLDARTLSTLAAEMQGFAVIPDWEMRVEQTAGSDRIMMIRPFVTSTLEQLLAQEEPLSAQRRHSLVEALIGVVRLLRTRKLVHGHISPSNIAEIDGGLVLLDPRLGAMHHSSDKHLAPEVDAGATPDESTDLYGLGSVLAMILGDAATHLQREIIDRLLLPAPRQRPALEEVEREFLRPHTARGRDPIRAGKLVRKTGDGIPARTPTQYKEPASRRFTWPVFAVCGLAIAVVVIKNRFPALFNQIFSHIPYVVAHHNSEYVLAWSSNDKAKMRFVIQAALDERDPAAENAIIEDTLTGENRPGVASNLLRVALSELWVESLATIDRRAALALSVSSLYPEGVKGLPDLSTLHPGVILALMGQSKPTKASPQLRALGLNRLTELPPPVGTLFEQLQASGSKNLGDPEVVALAGIVSGTTPPETLEAYLGSESSVAITLTRIAIALPLLSANEEMASQLLVTLRDRGGELGSSVGWFDIDALGMWSKATSGEKLKLLLGSLPERDLGVQLYADLLTFPLAAIREKSAKVLRSRYLSSETEQLFLVLSAEQNRLSREQTVALLSALSFDVAKRAPYIAILFQTNPSPDMILLVLLARSNKDSSDLFNLEAARLLRKSEWSATNEVLGMLANHSEPLARSLAYARLSARDPEHKKILQERVSEEGDRALLKSITDKLAIPSYP